MTQPSQNSPSSSGSAGLIALLERQHALYLQLQTLSQEQGELALQGAGEALLSVLGQRQKFIDELTALQPRMEPYRKRWAVIYAGLNPEDRRQVSQLVSQVQDLIARIIKQDERDRGVLQSMKTQVADELRKVNHAGAATRAYRSAPSGLALGGGGANRFTSEQG